MLVLAYAAAHPGSAGPLVLVGCGTFDRAARARLQQIREERTNDDMRRRLERLAEEFSDPGQRMEKRYKLTESVYVYDPISEEEHVCEPFDFRGNTESWGDMIRLQQEGVYPAAFAAIKSPVLMLHGAYDPHPGKMIRESLEAYLPQLEYRQWDHCGHSPWRERAVREEFFAVMREWLERHIATKPITEEADSP